MNIEHNAMPGSLELAYLGDTIYDLYVRTHLIELGGHVDRLHRQAIRLVCAHAQAEALGRIADLLTEEEQGVVRRARNTRQTPPKHADAAEYHRATAMEALLGYLYIKDRGDRLSELLSAALPEETIQQLHASMMEDDHA
ncbi:MAG: ribonuclease III [Clostridiales bacterium]|nr:ribonuclease III [Clostridiales bacterium]